jgi:hypothetical protein
MKYKTTLTTIIFITLIILLTNLIISEDISGGIAIEDTGGDSSGIGDTGTTGDTTSTLRDLSSATFDIDDPKTWFKDWNKIKSELKSNSANINSKWKKASKEDKNDCIRHLINQGGNNLKVTNLGSSELSLDQNGKLTNGKTQLDPQKLPQGVKSIEYNEGKKAFIYKFDKHQLIIRNGILNQDLTITGTSWPSDGLKWNGEGEFSQTGTGVTLKGSSKVKVGVMEVSRAKADQDAIVHFKEGDNGNKYVRGTNLHVLVKDFARIITPTDKETEVFIGNTPHQQQNQYVMLNPEGDEIKIVGTEITAEVLTDLKSVEVDGEKVVVKNGEIFFEFKKDKDGKDQTYTNAPKDGNQITVKNIRNPKGDLIVATSTTAEVTVDPEEPDEPETTEDPDEPEPATTTTTTTDDGRVKYTWNKRSKLNLPPITHWLAGNIMDVSFTLSDQDSRYINDPSQLPNTSPRLLSLSASYRNLPKNDFIDGLKKEAPPIITNTAQQIISGNSINKGSTIAIFSGGKGTGKASIRIYSKSRQLIGSKDLTGQNAETVIDYINGQYKKGYK